MQTSARRITSILLRAHQRVQTKGGRRCPPCSRSKSEGEAEGQLRDAHEPCLKSRLTEIRVTERIRPSDRPHIDPIGQIEELEFELRCLGAEPEILDEYRVDVRLSRRTFIRDRPRRISPRERGGGRERSRVQPCCRRVIRR